MPEEERQKWAVPYKAALLELDRGKLLDRINEARAAIRERMLELSREQSREPKHQEERQAIEDALHNLRVLAKLDS